MFKEQVGEEESSWIGYIWTFLTFVFTGVFMLSYIIQTVLYQVTKNNILASSKYELKGVYLIFGALAILFYYIAKRDEASTLKKVSYYLQPITSTLVLSYVVGLVFPGFLMPGIIISLIVGIGYGAIYTQIEQGRERYDEYMNEKDDDENIVQLEDHPGDYTIGHMYRRNIDEDGNLVEGEPEYIPTKKMARVPIKDRFLHFLVIGVTGSGKTSQTLIPMTFSDFSADNFKFGDMNVVQMGQIILEPKGDYAKTAWAIGRTPKLIKEKRRNYLTILTGIKGKLKTKLSDSLEEYRRLKDKGGPGEFSQKELKKYKQIQELYRRDLDQKLSPEKQLRISDEFEDLKARIEGQDLTPDEATKFYLLELSIKNLNTVIKQVEEYVPLSSVRKMNEFSTHALFKYASLLSEIEANPETYEKSWEDLKNQDPYKERDIFQLFDPQSKTSSYFNPLYGEEDTVAAAVANTLTAFNADSNQYFKDLGRELATNSIRVVKRVKGDKATLSDVNDMFNNTAGRGEDFLNKLTRMPGSSVQEADNRELADYFLSNYYPGLEGERGKEKTYQNSSAVRTTLNNLLDNDNMRRVLNPPEDVDPDQLIDFEKILRTGDKIALSTATGSDGSIGAMLGMFLILQIQSDALSRPGTEDTRTPVILYIDEFQDYATPSFETVLTQGRSYRVSAVMATQTLGLVAEKAGSGLVENIKSNARNNIIYPGASAEDAKYFVNLLGHEQRKLTKRSISSAVKDDSRWSKFKADIGISDEGGGGPDRESVSTDIAAEERFTMDHVMYGPNNQSSKLNENQSFTYVFYRLVASNSPQVPSLAKIEFMPAWLKAETDQIIRDYDVMNGSNLQPKKEEAVKVNKDPLKNESSHKQETAGELIKGTDKTSDPEHKERNIKENELTNEFSNLYDNTEAQDSISKSSEVDEDVDLDLDSGLDLDNEFDFELDLDDINDLGIE